MQQPPPISESQLKALENVLTALLGGASTFVVKWFFDRKSRKEKDTEHVVKIAGVTAEQTKTAQALVDIMQDIMADREKLFVQQIENTKKQCTDEIRKVESRYDFVIDQLKLENIKISQQLVSLLLENKKSIFQVSELKKRLSLYEQNITDELDKRFTEEENKLLKGKEE